jgi:osmotically-inducible protein OsmY
MNLKQWIALLIAFSLLAPACLAYSEKQLSDDAIYDLVKRRLANDPDVKGGALQIEVKQRVVTLRGKLETGKQKQKADKLARKVSGVKQVINEIVLIGK